MGTLRIGLLLIVAGCGGAVDADPPDATSVALIECTEHTDCPDLNGYRTCRAGYCTWRCDSAAAEQLCADSGAVCVDLGADNVFCERP